MKNSNDNDVVMLANKETWSLTQSCFATYPDVDRNHPQYVGVWAFELVRRCIDIELAPRWGLFFIAMVVGSA